MQPTAQNAAYCYRPGYGLKAHRPLPCCRIGKSIDVYGRTVARHSAGERDLSCEQIEGGFAVRRYGEICLLGIRQQKHHGEFAPQSSSGANSTILRQKSEKPVVLDSSRKKPKIPLSYHEGSYPLDETKPPWGTPWDKECLFARLLPTDGKGASQQREWPNPRVAPSGRQYKPFASSNQKVASVWARAASFLPESGNDGVPTGPASVFATKGPIYPLFSVLVPYEWP